MVRLVMYITSHTCLEWSRISAHHELALVNSMKECVTLIREDLNMLLYFQNADRFPEAQFRIMNNFKYFNNNKLNDKQAG